MTSMTPPRDHTYVFGYGAGGRLTSDVDPEGGSTVWPRGARWRSAASGGQAFVVVLFLGAELGEPDPPESRLDRSARDEYVAQDE